MSGLVQGVNLRGWQKDALRALGAEDTTDPLFIVTPGGGKTIFSALGLRQEAKRRGIARIAMFVPRAHLCKQSADAFARLGIKLDYQWQPGGRLGSDYDGFVITYHALAAGVEDVARIVDERWGIITDEIHHLSTNSVWGSSLVAATSRAALRLHMSGTPFRSDGMGLPFLRYSLEQEAVPTFSYDYPEGVRDGVVRPVRFTLVDGDVEWDTSDGKRLRMRMSDVGLAKKNWNERLRTAIQREPFVDKLLRAADQRLRAHREVVPDAAVLLTAMNQEHARWVADRVVTVTGEIPTVVLSEDGERAQSELNAFSRGSGRYIVAVQMVNEGVDVPRLTIGVPLTNRMAEMSLRQWTGRFVRRRDGETLAAEAICPADPRYRQFAAVLQKSVKATREQSPETAGLDKALKGGAAGESGYAAIAAYPTEEYIIEPEGAKSFKRSVSGLDLVAGRVDVAGSGSATTAPEMSSLRHELTSLVHRVAREANVDEQSIQGTLALEYGPLAGVASIQDRIERCRQWLNEGYDGFRNIA